MKPVRVAALAEEDLAAIHDWYEEEQAGLGLRFLESFQQTSTAIGELPHRYPVVEGDVRRAPVRPFPYGVYFRERPEEILIFAVVHLRRRPTTWRHSR